MRKLLSDPVYVRNVVFGVEDSLVSTVGLLSGIAAESQSHAAILSTGVIYICVEALSMAVGSFLSEESAQEIAGKGPGKIRRAAAGGAVMLVSFVVAGFVPIFPYLLATGTVALAWSVALSLALLFVLGFAPVSATRTGRLLHGVRMAILGGAAIVVGVIVGSIFHVS
jgi:VIT1/CCC1 family predicted Fe2+/Mn2+ transporter